MNKKIKKIFMRSSIIGVTALSGIGIGYSSSFINSKGSAGVFFDMPQQSVKSSKAFDISRYKDPQISFSTASSQNFVNSKNSYLDRYSVDDRAGSYDSGYVGDFLANRRSKIDHWQTDLSKVWFLLETKDRYDGVSISDDSFTGEKHKASHGTSTKTPGGLRGAEYTDTDMQETWNGNYKIGDVTGFLMNWYGGEEDYSHEIDWWTRRKNTLDNPNSAFKYDDKNIYSEIQNTYDKTKNSLKKYESIVSDSFRITKINIKVKYKSDEADDASLDNLYYKYSFEYKYSVKYDFESMVKDSGIFKFLFSPLKNSTPQKDLTRGEAYWVDNYNPPEFHIGLNNDLFEAYDKLNEKSDLNKSIISNSSLSLHQKTTISNLVNEYKIDKDNFADSLVKIKAGESLDNLIPRNWSKYITDPKYILKNGLNVVAWLNASSKLENPVKNYVSLSTFLNDSKIDLKFINNHSVVNNEDISLNKFVDYPIKLANTNNQEFLSKITFSSLTIKNPKIGNVTVADLWSTENFENYYVDYDSNAKTYSAFYQPNPLDISSGVTFHPLGTSGVEYDKDLNVIDNIRTLDASQKDMLYEDILSNLEKAHDDHSDPHYVQGTELQDLHQMYQYFGWDESMAKSSKKWYDKDDFSSPSLHFDKPVLINGIPHQIADKYLNGVFCFGDASLIHTTFAFERIVNPENMQLNPFGNKNLFTNFDSSDWDHKGEFGSAPIHMYQASVYFNSKKSFSKILKIDGKEISISCEENNLNTSLKFIENGKVIKTIIKNHGYSSKFSSLKSWFLSNLKSFLGAKAISIPSSSYLGSKYYGKISAPGITGEKAYKAILYDFTKDAQVTQVPFVLPSVQKSNDLGSWVTTDDKKQTLSEALKAAGQTFDKKKVTFVVNKELVMMINPYLDKTAATATTPSYWINPSFNIQSVVDVFNGKEKVLADKTLGALSDTFDDGFSITRTGKPTLEGLLGPGTHSVSAKIEHYPGGGENYRIFVQTKMKSPKIENIDSGDKQKYYKDEGKYFPLYTSIEDVPFDFVEKGIRQADLSWVDSEGNWYTKKLPITSITTNEVLMQEAKQIVDYQGLFKFEYKDLAGNYEKIYLWIEQDKNDSSVIAKASVDDAVEKSIVGQASDSEGQMIWINEKTSKDNIIIKNLLADKIIIKEFDKDLGVMKVIPAPSWMKESKQVGTSLGASIGSGVKAHSLAGDELAPLIPGTGVTKKSSSQSYYQEHLNVPFGKYVEIEAETNVFVKDAEGNFVAQPTMVKILNDDRYSVPSMLHTKNTPDIMLTEASGITSPTKNIYEPSDQERFNLGTSGEDIWRKVEVNYDPKIISKFTQSIKVEWSPLWYNWYKNLLFVNGQDVILSKEGKYKITYVDLDGNSHVLKYLVYDYPRNFDKYIINTEEVGADGKTSVITKAFYSNPAIATTQESSEFEFKGEFDWSGSNMPQWSKFLKITPVKYYYDFVKHISADSLDDLKAKLGNDLKKEFIKIDPVFKTFEVTDEESGVSKKIKTWVVSGKGWSKNQLDNFASSKTHYKVEGSSRILGIPLGVPEGVTVTDLKDSHSLSNVQLSKTSYWDGKYIDVYEESGHLAGLLIDDDDDPLTPLVHQLEDYDHYQTLLAEWLANGGTKEGFFQAHTKQDGGNGGKDIKEKIGDHKEIHNENEKKSDRKSLPAGIIFGTLGGVIVLVSLGLFIFFKRRGSGYAKGKINKPKKGKKNKTLKKHVMKSDKPLKSSETKKKRVKIPKKMDEVPPEEIEKNKGGVI